jgi:hypothetical protein
MNPAIGPSGTGKGGDSTSRNRTEKTTTREHGVTSGKPGGREPLINTNEKRNKKSVER